MRIRHSLSLGITLLAIALTHRWNVQAADPSTSELATTRPEMKKRIDGLKHRTARLPLPPLTPEDRAAGRPVVNNARLRSLYLPPSWQPFLVPGWSSTTAKPGASTTAILNALQASPDYAFKTRLFWIVSRTNDCQYCLGHQELKLKRVGMTEDQIASLDSRWDLFPAAEQSAMKASRKLTIAPHQFGTAEIAELRHHFSDSEIIDIIYTVARYNSVNRWTASTGIPQDQSFGGEEPSQLDTPTSAEFSSVTSQVAPLDYQPRPEWESLETVQSEFGSARSRSPAVELPAVDEARRAVTADTPGVIPPSWFQAIARLSIALDAWKQRQAMVRDGKTPAALRIQIAWVTARENRAWYAAGHAYARHLASGGEASRLHSFASLEQNAEAGHAEALRFARKLTSAPHSIRDDDIARLRAHFSDHEVAEIIQLTCESNAFDRLTEALRLPLEFSPDSPSPAR